MWAFPFRCSEDVMRYFDLYVQILLGSDGDKGGLDMTVTLCHRYTPPEDLAKAVQASDLVVSAAGVPGIITRLVQIRLQVTLLLSGILLSLALFWWMLGLPGFAISERTWLLGMFIKKRGRFGIPCQSLKTVLEVARRLLPW